MTDTTSQPPGSTGPAPVPFARHSRSDSRSSLGGGGGGFPNNNNNNNDDESIESKDAHTDLLEFPSSIRGVMRSQSLQALRRPTDGGGVASGSGGSSGAGLLSPLRAASGGPRMAPGRTRSGRLRRAPPGRSLSSDDGPIFKRNAPGRTKSSNDGLVGFRRSATSAPPVELSVGSGILLEKDRSRGIGRQSSFDSTWSCDSDLESNITADSINLRKHQLIADPLEGAYSEGCSVADHESMYDNMSQWSREYYDEILEFLPDDQPIYDKDYIVMVGGGGGGNNRMEEQGAVAYLTLDALKLRRPSVQIITDQQCEVAAFAAARTKRMDGKDMSSSNEGSASETTDHLDDLDDTNDYDETNGEDITDTTD